MNLNPPVTPSTPVYKNSSFKFIFILIAISVLIIGLTFAIRSYPQNTQKNADQQKTAKVYAQQFLSPNSNFNPSQQQKLLCPLISSFCLNKTNLSDGTLLVKLSQNTPLFAAFDGDLQLLVSFHPTGLQKQQFSTAILSSPDLGLIAYYEFVGSGSEKRYVKEGEIIATASSQLLPANPSYSLAFQVISVDSTSSARLLLNKTSFKQ